jgi:hypothetical protein
MLAGALRARAAIALVALSSSVAAGCGSCASGAQGLLGIMPGVVNDPSNRALRRAILQFGMGQFCHEMQTRDAPLSMAPDAPAIGRFYATTCQQQELQNGDWFVQFAGFGYGWTAISRKVTFTMSGAVVYDADFQLSGSTMYIYFRPRQVQGASFQSHVVEQPVASFLNSLSNLGDSFGKQVVAQELNQGFTVIRDTNGSVDFAVGMIEVGKRPVHAVDVHGTDRVTWENARVEVHQGERDFIGPIEVKDSGRAIWLTATMQGPQMLDVALLRKDVGDASLRAYFEQAQAGPLAGPPIAADLMPAGAQYTHAWPVEPGQYYLLFDNTPTAGMVAPPMNPLDDRFATIGYAIQIGDAP